jgi:hypothetical protein
MKRKRWRIACTAASLLLVVLCCVIVFSCRIPTALIMRSRIKNGLRCERQFEKGHLDVYGNIPVVHLYGSPEDMGRQHGTLLHQSLNSMNGYLQAVVSDEEVARFHAYAREYEANLPDNLRRELKAMSDASDVPYINLVTLNVVPRMRCSTLAVWEDVTQDRKLIMGRNADYFGMGLDKVGSVIIVYHPDEGKSLVAVTYLTMVGAFTGVNEDGVAFGNMLVLGRNWEGQRDDGLPIQLALRITAHEATSAGDMCKRLRSRKHVIPMNVMVADAQTALVVELGTTDSAVRRGKDGVLAASNFFRSPDICSRIIECDRYDSLIANAEKHRGTFDARTMMEALYPARVESHSVKNLQAVVFEPEKRLMHVSINRVPAARGPYSTFDLRNLFADGDLTVTQTSIETE